MASHTSKRLLCVVIAFLSVLGHLTSAQGVTLEVKERNSTCIKAEVTASISVAYNRTNSTRTAIFSLPGTATVSNSSTCGGSGRVPLLQANFGDGHALSLSFTSDGSQYRVTSISLVYNLNDSSTFPGSSSEAAVTVATNSTGMLAKINTTYRCLSISRVSLGGGEVNISFSDVRLEAYMLANDLSPNETVCTADQTITTAAPKTSPATTAPTPTVPGTPDRGTYNVSNSNNTVCLLANMGLQLNLTYMSKSQKKMVQDVINMQPNRTKSSGSCDTASATLVLMDESTNLTFSFSLNTTSNKYHLSGIAIIAQWPDMETLFTANNGSLDYLHGSLGRSYMCSAEQVLSVDNTFSVNTFHLQVQPFGVVGGRFEAAEECQLDEDNMLIPIIVGAALAGLVLIVLIAYLIGRKRSHAGYQTI